MAVRDGHQHVLVQPFGPQELLLLPHEGQKLPPRQEKATRPPAASTRDARVAIQPEASGFEIPEQRAEGARERPAAGGAGTRA
jgi:hypothetical protein